MAKRPCVGKKAPSRLRAYGWRCLYMDDRTLYGAGGVPSQAHAPAGWHMEYAHACVVVVVVGAWRMARWKQEGVLPQHVSSSRHACMPYIYGSGGGFGNQ